MHLTILTLILLPLASAEQGLTKPEFHRNTQPSLEKRTRGGVTFGGKILEVRSNKSVGHDNIKIRIHNALHKCYVSSPSATYFPLLVENQSHHSIADNTHPERRSPQDPHNWLATLTSSIATKCRTETPLQCATPTTRKNTKRKSATSTEPVRTAPYTTVDTDETIEEPSSAVLSGITQPIVSEYTWSRLTGREFHFPSVIQKLVKMGIRTALPQSEEYIDWKPANSRTKKLIEDGVSKEDLRHALDQDMDVLVWTGKFKKEGYGSELPIVKSVSIVPMSPKSMAQLLMDSDRVKTYNKISLGRKDEVVFQSGIDTVASSGGFMLDGEAKIVRNVAKPPVVKKLAEFITLMCARRLRPEDNVGVGIMGDSIQENEADGDGSIGYVVMSRAVNGDRWRQGSTVQRVALKENDEDSSKENVREMTRNEILLGVNLLRSVPGQPNKTEVTAVTHVKAGVPAMLATKIGVKGAVDFVQDIRNLCE